MDSQRFDGKAEKTTQKRMSLYELADYFRRLLAPERDYYVMSIIYGVGISLLSLATPISVQMLINTVAHTGLTTPLVVLSVTLFVLLLISGLLNALRTHLMEIFGRRFFARMVSEIALRSVYAQNPFFSDESRTPLFNRYFDIIGVQKTMPILLIGGFTLILQAGVGFILVSLYHPLFLLFNLVLVGVIWIVWMIWGRGAVRTAIDLSRKKHEAAAWLEGLGSSNGFYKSKHHVAYALNGTNAVTKDYIEAHKSHFRQHFAQALSFFVIYAAASAALLGLGGWLVIQGQLTLGQLVAAELVLSAAFFGISQFGAYLNYFYDLCAAIEELSLFYKVAQEEPAGRAQPQTRDSSLSFLNVGGDARGASAQLTFQIPGGANVMAAASDHGLQRLVTTLLKRNLEPKGGYISFGGVDMLDIDPHALRQQIVLLDRPTIIETTIRKYLSLSAEEAAPETVLAALEAVGLAKVVARLEDGLDTRIATTGWPLSLTETMQLKLAGAIIARPRVLILNQLFDLLPEHCLTNAIETLRADVGVTLVYFSNRQRNLGFDLFLYLDRAEQTVFDAFDDFYKAAYGDPEVQPLSVSYFDRPVSLIEQQ